MGNAPTENLLPCPICGSQVREIHTLVCQCPTCGLETSDFQAGAGGGVDGLEKLRRQNFESIWKLLDASMLIDGGKLLEVGCAGGWFLENARARGIEAIGIEPSDYACEAIGKGFKVLRALFPEATAHFADGSFDFVVFNDVFEHIPNPKTVLVECSRLLSDDGKIIINIPVNDGFLYSSSKILKRFGWHGPFDRFWQKGYSSPHLFYYSESTLCLLLNNTIDWQMRISCGLRTVHLKGLWKRVNSGSEGLFQTLIIFALSAVFALVEKVLPNDVKVLVFEKAAIEVTSS